ncbi:MAG: alanyl-tRNA editing protein [Candidatus Brockarchaeota archaeon]|nr:alanyl-tRNA editing protein [Candidatus Brockarchaeota archaeon]
MLTALLYMDDSYLKEFDARVVEVLGDNVILDRTAFHPRGGGLPDDTGVLLKEGRATKVVQVLSEDGKVLHSAPGHGFSFGDPVKGILDWERRYLIMRMHTGIHALASVFNKRTGALITGNQVNVDKSRLDLNLEKMDRALIDDVFNETNRELASGRNVKIYYLPREEALKIPGIVKLAEATPPNVEKLRIVEIENLDVQADGGPHVANTREVGELVLLKIENKGKNNRRVYFALKSADPAYR